MTVVSVIGAGVVGLACATALTEAGHDVTVYDRGEGPGPASCSWWAGGMLAPWCEGESAEEPVERLGAEALDWWVERVDGVSRNGSLVVAPARDAADLRRFERRTRNAGKIDAERVAELEPDLAGRFRQALFFAGEGHLDPRAALAGLRQRLAEAGTRVRYGEDRDPETAPGDVVVDARGFAARSAFDDLRGVKGEMLVLRTAEVALSRPVRLLHPRIPLYIVPRGEGVFMVGATMIESDERDRISARAMMELLGGAYALHPAFAEAEILEIGVDVRPSFPDNLPRLTREGRIIRANGAYRHGFLLAPALAAQAAGLVSDPSSQPEFFHEHHRQRRTA
jgi:glycine oxidase